MNLVTTRATTLDTSMNLVTGRATTLEGRATTLDTSMNLVTGRATTLEGRATTLEGRVSTLDTSMNLVTGRATTLEGRVTTLDTSMNLVTGRVTTLDGSMNLVANQITLKANIASPTFTGTATFQAVTVGGASLSFTTLTDTTVLTLAGNYIVNANGNKIITLPASATAGNLITIYSPSYEYKLSANGASNATIAANAVTVCIYTSSSTWVAYASGVLVAFP
jgi:small nuclear ribonucleoprotein (snRNP)-like protein